MDTDKKNPVLHLCLSVFICGKPLSVLRAPRGSVVIQGFRFQSRRAKNTIRPAATTASGKPTSSTPTRTPARAPSPMSRMRGTSIAAGLIAISVSGWAGQKTALAKNSALPGNRATNRRWALLASTSGTLRISLVNDCTPPTVTTREPPFSAAAAPNSGGGRSPSPFFGPASLSIDSTSVSPHDGGVFGSGNSGVVFTPAAALVVTGER